MRKDILIKTNVFVCCIILVGFAITSVISYQSNRGIFRRDVEQVSNLTSQGIFYQIESIFTKPLNISLTMANDSLLKNFLSEEEQRQDDAAFLEDMRAYLLAYKEKYDYDSVFLVSTQTSRYYHFNGIDRMITPDNPENVWYYAFLEDAADYSLNIDNDEAANNEVTIFINCKIKGQDGNVMGVVGVGFRVDYLQALLKEYEGTYDVEALLVDGQGTIEISTDRTGYQAANLFDACGYAQFKEQILSNQDSAEAFWYSSGKDNGYLVAQYVPNLDWHLIIDYDTAALHAQLNQQLIGSVAVVTAIIAFVLITITGIIRKYNAQIVQLTVAQEQEHRTAFQAATEQLYENIYELDITHNRAASEATERYFEWLGMPGDTPFDKALHFIAQKQIKAEFQQGYIDTFHPDNVLQAFKDGISALQYDFMITNDGSAYYWMRITARIFRWEEDQSIRMFVYRQNIDAEKRQEQKMEEKAQRDPLSGLYNKAASQERIQALLQANRSRLCAFFILDIDNFKQVNDQHGHAFGDLVITDFARILAEQFRPGDIVGRIGGDEFAACIPAPSWEWAQEKAHSLVTALHHTFSDGRESCKITTSVGVALAPEAGRDFDTLYRKADLALYQTKKRGKDGFTLYTGR